MAAAGYSTVKDWVRCWSEATAQACLAIANDPTLRALGRMPNEPHSLWPLPSSADHPEFDEVLADLLTLRTSHLSRSRCYSEAQDTLEEASAALARASDVRMRQADRFTGV